MSGEFKTVSLGKPLYSKISKFVEENPEYRGVAEFVSEATRLRMESLTRLKLRKLNAKQEGPDP